MAMTFMAKCVHCGGQIVDHKVQVVCDACQKKQDLLTMKCPYHEGDRSANCYCHEICDANPAFDEFYAERGQHIIEGKMFHSVSHWGLHAE